MKIIRTLWMLQCFNKQTEALASKYELANFDVETWRSLIGIYDDEIFQGGFVVLPEHLEFLQPYVPEPIDLSAFDCFVAFYADYDWQRQKTSSSQDHDVSDESSSR